MDAGAIEDQQPPDRKLQYKRFQDNQFQDGKLEGNPDPGHEIQRQTEGGQFQDNTLYDHHLHRSDQWTPRPRSSRSAFKLSGPNSRTSMPISRRRVGTLVAAPGSDADGMLRASFQRFASGRELGRAL
ncbi:unnamed protein product [Prorocentrum cordatum]|uniref:Uncharacterized protein n=1 Tax=Prorocentrum cordatum TaxID=2364126 RepID=A0ABN9T3E9_9DINO|nr:unnamed protein product [Polarella glacialis]